MRRYVSTCSVQQCRSDHRDFESRLVPRHWASCSAGTRDNFSLHQFRMWDNWIKFGLFEPGSGSRQENCLYVDVYAAAKH